MKKQLSKSQIVCLFLLWIALCYIMLTSVKQINGPVILTVFISGALVFIPLYKAFKKNK